MGLERLQPLQQRLVKARGVFHLRRMAQARELHKSRAGDELGYLFAQFVVVAQTIEDSEQLRTWLIDTLNEQFPTVRSRVTRLENGPPVGYPVQFRVTGEHIEEVRALARKVATKVRENPHVVNVHLDWEEPSKVVYLNVDQDRARA